MTDRLRNSKGQFIRWEDRDRVPNYYYSHSEPSWLRDAGFHFSGRVLTFVGTRLLPEPWSIIVKAWGWVPSMTDVDVTAREFLAGRAA